MSAQYTSNDAPERIVSPTPSTAGRSSRAYAPQRHAERIDLRLDSNERCPDAQSLAMSLGAITAADMARYPSAAALEERIAAHLDIAPEQVLVTAGGDEAIDRSCRAYLEAGRELLTTTPTFEMIAKSARLTGAEVREVPWLNGAFPTAEVIDGVSSATGVIAVVTPNNPTGAIADAEALRQLSAAAPRALLLVDLAYTEFADLDLTQAALELPNVVVIRTFSKAWGLAGLRVGFAAGSPEVIGRLRAVGGPYTVSAASIAVARQRLDRGGADTAAHIARVREERRTLGDMLTDLCADGHQSQGNFVLAQFGDARWVADALASLGIGVRRFGGPEILRDRLRITCPGSEHGLDRLIHALRVAVSPEALLFDMDGVIADVSMSYRAAIRETSRSFGAEVTSQDIVEAKASGNANNDWVLTHRLVIQRGIDVTLKNVTERFEALYQGAPGRPGLRETESLLIPRQQLAALAALAPLGIVTGRPRPDCERFLDRFGIADMFGACVCMEDGPAKPDAGPVLLAMRQLGVGRAWLIGDTPDDVVAARRAGLVPLGVVAPEVDAGGHANAAAVLQRAGAARVLGSTADLLTLLEGSTCLGR